MGGGGEGEGEGEREAAALRGQSEPLRARPSQRRRTLHPKQSDPAGECHGRGGSRGARRLRKGTGGGGRGRQ